MKPNDQITRPNIPVAMKVFSPNSSFKGKTFSNWLIKQKSTSMSIPEYTQENIVIQKAKNKGKDKEKIYKIYMQAVIIILITR